MAYSRQSGFRHFYGAASFAILGAVIAPSTAQAGFEWVPAARNEASAPVADVLPPMPAVPRDVVETIDMGVAVVAPAPVVEDAPSALPARVKPALSDHPAFERAAPVVATPAPAPVVAPAPAPVLAAPVAPRPSVIAPPETVIASPFVGDDARPSSHAAPVAPVQTQTQAVTSSAFETAEGFGADIPLALALRQIVPVRYGYAFDPAVNQATLVTWNGGQGWDVVLRDALAPHGLGIVVGDDAVRVAPLNKIAAQTAPVVARASDDASVSRLTDVGDDARREVYVRRHSSGEAVVQKRTAGAVAEPPRGIDVQRREKSSFWSRLGLSSSERTELRHSDTRPTRQAHARLIEAPAPGDISTPPVEDRVMERIPLAQYEPVSLTQPPGAVAETSANTQSTGASLYSMNFWQAEKGDSLRNVLETWSNDAGVRLYWVPSSDYALPDAVRLQGSYTDAVTQILGAYENDAARPIGRLHPNLPAGPSVLIIEPASNG